MSYPSTQLGSGAFNHGPSSSAEQEYDRLRDLARKEQGQHQHYAAESQQAYQRGDGAKAHELSVQSKKHAAQADAYNKQASEYIFRENNAMGKVAGDTIDLHGQYVEEAEEILEQRIRYAKQTGQSHLHVIVGKGCVDQITQTQNALTDFFFRNHSVDHVQKIKPRVEQICRELGIECRTEENEGRLYLNLQGGSGEPHSTPGYNYSHEPHHENYGKPHYETAYPMGNAPQYSYAQAAGGHEQMSYSGKPHQQMQTQEPPPQKESKCCGLCVVM